MNHSDIIDRIFSYVDGQLPLEERGVVELHLRDCADCRDILESWDQASKSFLQPLQTNPSEFFVQNVMRKIRTYVQKDEGIRWRHFTHWAIPALALSACSFVGILAYLMQPASVSTESLLLADSEPSLSTEWISNPPNEDQLLDSVVVTQ